MSERTEEQQELLMDHDYDGIEEYDNPMPRWWVNIFWASIIYSVGYVIYYHLGGPGLLKAEEYALEVQRFNEARSAMALAADVDEEGLEALMSDAAMMEEGREQYATKCAACHGPQGEGLIGPNLTDAHWVHGHTLMDIYRTVDEGVLDKGMPAWGRAMRPEELRAVVAYVGAMRGKNLPGRAPEGEEVQ